MENISMNPKEVVARVIRMFWEHPECFQGSPSENSQSLNQYISDILQSAKTKTKRRLYMNKRIATYFFSAVNNEWRVEKIKKIKETETGLIEILVEWTSMLIPVDAVSVHNEDWDYLYNNFVNTLDLNTIEGQQQIAYWFEFKSLYQQLNPK